MKCSLCLETFKQKELQQHINETCPKAIIDCPIYGCVVRIKREELNQHLTTNVVMHVLLQNEAFANRLNKIELLLNRCMGRIDKLEKRVNKNFQNKWKIERKQCELVDKLKGKRLHLLFNLYKN